ncbi:MAG: class I SAM-dependent methyltransferase [Candidatus Atribacteria bacterium]|nr:MAG: class I SAM-dependent methyltransferase [Candidatus Atribacteria bacterium]
MIDVSRDPLRQAYDNEANTRDRQALPAWKKREREAFFSEFRKRGLQRLLEVGAGTGRDSRYFQDAGCDVTCIDLSSNMVRLCQDKGLDARVMDVAALSFPTNSFDGVYAFNSLLHLEKSELPDVLLEIQRVLNPGGLFYFGTYGGFDHEGIYQNDDHVPKRFFSFYDDEHLRRVVGQSFEILEFRSVSRNVKDLRFQSLLLRKPCQIYTCSRREGALHGLEGIGVHIESRRHCLDQIFA